MNQDSAQIRKRRTILMHKFFFVFACVTFPLFLIASFIAMPNECAVSFYLCYALFYLGQSIQHYLCLLMPNIDVVKHSPIIKRLIGVVIITDIIYFFLAFMFWTKSHLHPLYCFICQQLGLSSVFGILLMLHFVVALFFFIQLLHKYITRKYYLLALGGFAVEQRLIQQRQENMRRINLIEPYYNEYPMQPQNKPNKYYVFDDIPQDVEGEEVCSICLTRNKEGHHPVMTPCKHYFHRQCIEDWAKINSRCPQCRTQFTEKIFDDIINEEDQNQQNEKKNQKPQPENRKQENERY